MRLIALVVFYSHNFTVKNSIKYRGETLIFTINSLSPKWDHNETGNTKF